MIYTYMPKRSLDTLKVKQCCFRPADVCIAEHPRACTLTVRVLSLCNSGYICAPAQKITIATADRTRTAHRSGSASVTKRKRTRGKRCKQL